ncbi:Rv1535 family protein [Mycobacterium paraterrae]|uniref:Rv1535 family protein n=1 Tax=Mycobacterium paraterrae TaxID=577492 RepID=A0ABY3VDL7_9MYCO|nr:Rv1535 family protein [Mycobacterium paraterrae]UMB67544.1 Rv1535 family protein [Mycobacterium paraterrae]
MTAVLYDEVVAATSAPRLTLVPDPAPAATAPKRREPRIGGGDPLVDGAARLLCVPLRQLYAALWRAGVIEVGG